MKFKLALSTILTFLFIPFIAAPAFAARLEITLNGAPLADRPLFSEVDYSDIKPGDSATECVTVKNTSDANQLIKVEALNIGDTDSFSSQFNFWVVGSATYFYGTLEDFLNWTSSASDPELALSILASGASEDYCFTFQLPTSVGNDWQKKEVRFDLELGFDYDEPTGGGDDGKHLVCHDNNMCVLENGEQGDDGPCDGKYQGSFCNYSGSGDLPTPPGGDNTPPGAVRGAGVAGASTGAPPFGGEGETLEGGSEQEEPEVAGAATGNLPQVEGVASGRGECCCLWWLFILGQLLVQIGYLIKIKGYKTTYGRLALVYLASALGFYILYRLLCSWLTSIIGCIWPSVYLLQFCRWYILIALFVLIFGALPYFLIRSKKGKPATPPKTQSFLKD